MEIKLSQADLQELAGVLSLEEIQTAGDIVEAATTLAEANEQVRQELTTAQAKAKEYDTILKDRREQLTALVEKTRPEKNNAGTLRIITHMSFADMAELEAELNDELAAQFPDGGRSSKPNTPGGGETAKATVPATAFQS
jgi:transcriptional regulator of heat shock response